MKQITKLEDEYIYRERDGKVYLHDIYPIDEGDIINKINEIVDEINKLKRKRPTKNQRAKWVKKYQ